MQIKLNKSNFQFVCFIVFLFCQCGSPGIHNTYTDHGVCFPIAVLAIYVGRCVGDFSLRD